MRKCGRKKITALLLTVCIVISSISAAELHAKAADTKKGWNINIYMCGSDLESEYGLASLDLLEIMDARNVPAGVQITVETGGSSCWKYDEIIEEYYRDQLHMTEKTIETIHPGNISSKYIQRYRVKYDNYIQQGGDWIQYPTLELISSNEGVNDPEIAKANGEQAVSMGDADIFGDFVKDTVQEDKYNVMVLWNHGGGTEYGICLDELSKDSLLLSEMEQGLLTGTVNMNGKKLDMVGFDACLMASFETLAVTSRYADYAVASMNDNSGYGWYYTPVIEELSRAVNQEQTYSVKEFAVSIVDSAIDFYLRDPESVLYFPTLNIGAYDLSYMEELVEQFDKLAQTMVHLTADDTMLDGFMKAADEALKLDESMDLVGLYSFLEKTTGYAQDYMKTNQSSSKTAVLENVTNCREYTEQAQIFAKALYEGDFCIKQCTGAEGNKYSEERGIGLYYPVNDTMDMTGFAKWQYDELHISKYYSAFVYRVYRKIAENQAIVPKTTLSWSAKKGKYVLNLTNVDAKYMAYIREMVFLKLDGKKLRVRSVKGSENGNTMECEPVRTYYKFQGKPIYVGPLDSETGEYFLTVGINGSGMQKLFFAIEDGKYVVRGGLKVNDVITPFQWDENDESTEDKEMSYTIQESDVAEDGSVYLPMEKVTGKNADFVYDFLVGNNFGEETHQWVTHTDTLNFVKAKATLSKKTYKATGKKIYPAVTVKIGSKVLKKGKDYKLVYSDNLAAGKATVKVVGIGKYAYAPAKTLHFTIKVNK
ncbi:MAG: clostripain-related cysteine peptidase [Lachnospiraceae bacterium]